MRSQPSLAAADAVGGPVDGEERVAGVVVAVELVVLPLSVSSCVELGDLLRRRVLVLVAEQAEQRAAQVRQLVDEVGDLRAGSSSGGVPVTNAP